MSLQPTLQQVDGLRKDCCNPIRPSREVFIVVAAPPPRKLAPRKQKRYGRFPLDPTAAS
jgi:hypothetical protein